MIILKKLVLGVSLAVVALIGVNVGRVHMSAHKALKCNDELTVASYYRFGVVPDTIVFDLWNVGWDSSSALILGRFFAFAEEMKDRDFREVHLAYKGRTKFILDGDHFQEIGRQHSWQNPIYTIRTFPEKLLTSDGRRAYSSWSGGVLGVLNAQMDDVNQMARVWYLDEMIRS